MKFKWKNAKNFGLLPDYQSIIRDETGVHRSCRERKRLGRKEEGERKRLGQRERRNDPIFFFFIRPVFIIDP